MESSSAMVPFPLLTTPIESNYRACTIPYRFDSDNPRKATPTEISWINLFLNSVPSFRQRAESDTTVVDAPIKAEKFAERYTALVEKNIPRAVKDMEKVLDMSLHQIAEESNSRPPEPPSYSLFSKQFIREHGRDLFATSTAWFLVDVIFYTGNLFQSLIYSAEFKTYKKELAPAPDKPTPPNAYDAAFDVAKLQAIIAIASTIPGYWASVFFIDRMGRVKIQIMGFLIISICLFVLGRLYNDRWYKDPDPGFYSLLGLTFFFSNFGPNTTSFIVPAELFPARLRSTCHGISGAVGKLGAIIGTVGFLWVSQSTDERLRDPTHPPGNGMHRSLMILGGVGVLGAVVTYFFTP